MPRPLLSRLLRDAPEREIFRGRYDAGRQLTLDGDGKPAVLGSRGEGTRTFTERPDNPDVDTLGFEPGTFYGAGTETFTKARPDPTDPADPGIAQEASVVLGSDSSSGIIAY